MERDPYTLEDIAAMDKNTITPDVASDILECNPQWIRIAARTAPERLGFPVICLEAGSRSRGFHFCGIGEWKYEPGMEAPGPAAQESGGAV